MASHRQIEEWWADRRCVGPHVSLNLNGRYPVRVQPELEAATVALSDAIVANGYRTPMGPTGSYNCRQIAGSTTWSLHSYAVAIDWDYPANPYDKGGAKPVAGFGTDPRFALTEAQINAVEAIRNEDGDPIWRWLGWTIADFMHFQVDVPPDKCQPYEEPDMEYRGVLNVPDRDWARAVVDWGIETGVINVTDDHTDDWERDDMTDGRFWTFLQRYDRYRDSLKPI